MRNVERFIHGEEDNEDQDDVNFGKTPFSRNGEWGPGGAGINVIKKCEVLFNEKPKRKKKKNQELERNSVDRVYFSSGYKHQAVILDTAGLQS